MSVTRSYIEASDFLKQKFTEKLVMNQDKSLHRSSNEFRTKIRLLKIPLLRGFRSRRLSAVIGDRLLLDGAVHSNVRQPIIGFRLRFVHQARIEHLRAGKLGIVSVNGESFRFPLHFEVQSFDAPSFVSFVPT